MLQYKKRLWWGVVAAALLFLNGPSAEAVPYEYEIYTWANNGWHFYNTGAGDSPANVNPSSHGSVNLGLAAPNDTYGVAFAAGSDSTLLLSHTFDNHLTEWGGGGTIIGGPGNSDEDSIAASHVGSGIYAGNYLYMRNEDEKALNVYKQTGPGSFEYAATEAIMGGPATASLEEIGLEWIGGGYNRSFLYLHDTAAPAMQVYEWRSGVWQWVTTEAIFGTSGDEDWSNYSVLWDGQTTYLSVVRAHPTEIPEPASGMLLGSAVLSLVGIRRRKARNNGLGAPTAAG